MSLCFLIGSQKGGGVSGHHTSVKCAPLLLLVCGNEAVCEEMMGNVTLIRAPSSEERSKCIETQAGNGIAVDAESVKPDSRLDGESL